RSDRCVDAQRDRAVRAGRLAVLDAQVPVLGAAVGGVPGGLVLGGERPAGGGVGQGTQAALHLGESRGGHGSVLPGMTRWGRRCDRPWRDGSRESSAWCVPDRLSSAFRGPDQPMCRPYRSSSISSSVLPRVSGAPITPISSAATSRAIMIMPTKGTPWLASRVGKK